MRVKFSLKYISVIFPGLFFLTASIPSHAQRVEDNIKYIARCDNVNSPRYATRLDVKVKALNQFAIVGVDLTTTFIPELVSRQLTPNFYRPGVSQSFTAYQTVRSGPLQESVAWGGQVRVERLVGRGRNVRLQRAVGVVRASNICLPSPNQPIGQNPSPNPSPDPTPPPSSCTENEYNGYYCPPVAFASPSRLVASSVVYIEPQATDAVGSQASLELGTWEGTQWG
jgi:hypothetical protein